MFDAKADLNGNRTSRAFEYTEAMTLIAPGGDYLVVAKRGETLTEATTTVKPGERMELTIPGP